MSGTVEIDLETNDQNLNKLIGPYSSIFEDNSSKGNIKIEYYDDNAGTIGVYMWDSYRNNVTETNKEIIMSDWLSSNPPDIADVSDN